MCGKPPHHNALQCTYKEMRNKDTIPHLKKCFSYAIDQNKGTSAQLTKTLRSIPDHLYNHRENCGEWCQRKNGVGLQKVILHDKHLYNNLHNIFNKYANNAPKFSVVTSSQGNESLNNIMAHKAPKNNCYSLSESADFRLASAVASKNDGDSYLMKVKKILSLSPGKDTESYVRSQDSIRKKRAVKAKLAIFKKRRNMLAIKRKALRTKNATFEGIQYQSNCGMETDSGFVPTSSNLISFNNVTLLPVSQFLSSISTQCLLVAHNARFDSSHLIHSIVTTEMVDKFSTILLGFTDTLAIFRKNLPERKGRDMFKLEQLA
ncbi:hypothetical protein PV328_008340 [Microctonus aethiopoides]|uniref:Exonuclease domain-containing protein n=1 Tax=Microctonus aethiopoides TaxID=144406 RepID=A0AA39KQZ8_9HYME|nr:hypothetical protein PV328_008340 [Microctonus aethiopoides]